ncbi:MAG: Gldg family protein, partial [FCB group bacterium]|nr:Gldg family protein [FCB group bacterium]
MKSALTIFRRDLSAFFTSPIGYIFMIVFLLMGVGLYITSFFTFPVADMRSYFSNLPILLCVFLPAVTMRIWAEERKENTWEMLLTFPMKAWQLVIGKFLAVLAFFTLTLVATLTVPLMLAVLGDPDGGAIFGGYLGTFLLGAFFLAVGIFISGLCRDQIVAFVVTLLACFLIFLLGTNFISAYIDGVFPGLGSRLAMFVGMLDHYNAFVRGVVEIADVFYFVAWTAIFLFLNMLFIEGRSRPKAKLAFAGSVVMSLAIGFLVNWLLVDQSLGRFDMTENKIYTVSPASTSIMADLKQPIQVNVYITPKDKMPTGMKTLEQDVVDKLDELRIASKGKLQFKTIHLEAANMVGKQPEIDTAAPGEEKEKPKDEKEAIEERMLAKGVQPFAVQAIEEDTVTSKLIYSSIGVQFGATAEEIIPQVAPQTLPDLEYRLISTVNKLTRDKKPVIALVAPEDALNIPPEVRQMYAQMGQQLPQADDPFDKLQQYLQHEKYEVRRIKLNQQDPLPEEFDALVILDPRSFNERQ